MSNALPGDARSAHGEGAQNPVRGAAAARRARRPVLRGVGSSTAAGRAGTRCRGSRRGRTGSRSRDCRRRGPRRCRYSRRGSYTRSPDTPPARAARRRARPPAARAVPPRGTRPSASRPTPTRNPPALGCNGYITCLEQNRHSLSKLTKFGVPSPVVTRFGVPLHQSTCLGELYTWLSTFLCFFHKK